jgi:hypothetical protein
MELGLAVLVLVCLIVVSIWVPKYIEDTWFRAEDDREPYLRNSKGKIWALVVEDDVDHEAFIHDGTPHQNPAVREESRGFFFPKTIEIRYYPLTVPKIGGVDFESIRQKVNRAAERGVPVALVTLDDPNLERDVIRRETSQQMDRDVPRSKMKER